MHYPKIPKSARHAHPSWHSWAFMVAACLCTFDAAWAQNSAAVVMSVSGQATAVDVQGRERVLEKGAELFAGDKVQTADASLVQMRLHDGGYMSVRANTEMVIDRFEHDLKDPGKSSFLVSLLRGGFRSITGLIGRSNPTGYQIRAGTATIGIRGTDHEPVLVLDTPEAQLQTPGAPGLYDKVNDGETFISSNSGVISLKRGDVGFSPLSDNVAPQVLLKVPDFYKIVLRTDARDPKDGSADGNKGAGTLLRPSVAARRAAQAGGSGVTATPVNDSNVSARTPPTAPNTPTAPAKPAPTGAGTGTAATHVLTPEQKRAIFQALTQTVPRTATTVASPTPTAPLAPVAPIAPLAPVAPIAPIAPTPLQK